MVLDGGHSPGSLLRFPAKEALPRTPLASSVSQMLSPQLASSLDNALLLHVEDAGSHNLRLRATANVSMTLQGTKCSLRGFPLSIWSRCNFVATVRKMKKSNKLLNSVAESHDCSLRMPLPQFPRDKVEAD